MGNSRIKKILSASIAVIAVIVCVMLSVFMLIRFTDVGENANSPEISENTGEIAVNIDNEPEISEDASEPEPEPIPEPEPAESRISFVAVGDNIVHSTVLADAQDKAEGTEKEYNFVPMFENIADVIMNADLAYINQESPIAGKDRGYSGYPMFNSPEQVGYDLKELGFDIVNMANNHMLDRYTSGYKSTIEYWQSIEDITYIGGYMNEEDYNNIRVIEKDGITIALLAYTYGTNGIYLENGSEMIIPLCDQYSNDEIDRQTRLAREIADIVIVSVHWGNEDWFEPSWLQEQQMEIMVNNNVDVILGSHPHVLEPMLWMDRPDGERTLVIYSLGNFLSGMEYMRNHIGGIAGFDIVEDESGAYIENVSFIPTVCHFDNKVRNFKIYRFSEYTEEMLRTHGTQVRGTDSRRSMDYLRKIIDDTIPAEFLVEDFYKNSDEVTE